MKKSKVVCIIALCACTGVVQARTDALDTAAAIAGVPREIIESIIKVESGGHPFSLNTNSELGSLRFKSMHAAREALALLISKGYRNIDVGPAQVNIRWHPDLYKSPEDLLHPSKNIIAAGHVLRKNKEAGAKDLRQVVGHYHSRTPERANDYAAKVLGKKK